MDDVELNTSSPLVATKNGQFPVIARNGTIKSINGKDDETRNKKGLTLWTAAIFILGEMAGSGVLALPNAVVNAGWTGLGLIALFCATSGFSGTRLGYCWIMLEERYEEYRKAVKSPYPSIGFRAYGKWMMIVVSSCVNFTLFGVGTVFLLLSSQLVGNIFNELLPMSPCVWILIIASALTPFMWLGTPKDFWPVAIGAAVSTTLACIMVVVRCLLDESDRGDSFVVEYPTPTFSSFFLAFGTILFSYGGASTFPTIQNDMKDRTQFSKSVAIAFVGLAILYIPVATIGYVVFGSNVQVNILQTLTHGSDIVVVQILLAVHLFFAFVIIINPFCQDCEERFHVPNEFGWRRCALRTCIMILIIFVGQTVPHFGKILDLVGGSTITLLTFVFPPLFYMKLVDMHSPGWNQRSIPKIERIFLWSLICVGAVGGAVATVNALGQIAAPDAFSLPCYISGGQQ